MSSLGRIIHPTDFSPASTPAFTRAVEAAKENRAELVVVHVLSTVIPIVGDGYISPQAYDDMQKAARAQGKKQLDALVEKAKKGGAQAVGVLLEGTAWDQITRIAKSKHADMIIMGTHGRTGLAKLFLGSVAERVVGTAPCPVMTVRGRRP